MRLVIFGLTITSSWGNGHATIWRALCTALANRGHEITFFERDVSFYAAHRDLQQGDAYKVILYSEWKDVEGQAQSAVAHADSAIVTSYCQDALAASNLILDSDVPVRVYYDLDTPVTLERLRQGETVDYIPPYGLGPFDLVLSYAGGRAVEGLRQHLGARRVAPLYGSVNPGLHRSAQRKGKYRSDLSYLGTYAKDRQPALEELLLKPARRSLENRFLIGGALYPDHFPWSENIWFVHHVPPAAHPAFYCSSRLTLSVTRAAMAEMGYCPSGRLFEAAACETPLVTDRWEGLEDFFEPGSEILVAATASDILNVLALSSEELKRIGTAARERVLAEHTAERRSEQLIQLIEASA